MGAFSAGGRSTGAGSATLPVFSLYGSAAGGGLLKEIGIVNTTAVAVALALMKLSTAGTQGAGLIEADWNAIDPTANCAAFQTHTGAPTLGDDLGYRAILGAVIGSTAIWVFDGPGIEIPLGTANGIGVIVPTGTGQIVDFWMRWSEG